MIAVDVVIGWRVLANSTFFADDFINVNDARQLGLGDGLFSRSVFGHFIPGFNYSDYVIALARPWSWSLIMIIVLVVYLSWLLLADRLLNALGTQPLARSLIVLVLGTSIITITDTPWWSTSIQYHVLILTLVAAIYCHIRYVTTQRIGYATGVVIAITVGLAFLEDAVVTPLFLLLLSALVLTTSSHEGGPTSRLRWVVAHWRLWTAYAVPVVFDVVWRFTHRATYASYHPAPTTGAFLKFLWLFVVRTFVPLITGIFAWNLTNTEQIAVEVATPLLWLGVLAFLYSRGVGIGRILILTFVPLLVTGVLVGLTRVQLLGVGTSASDPKYVTLPYVMALLAGAFSWHYRDRSRAHAPTPPWLRLGVLSLVAGSMVISLVQLPPLLAGTDSAKHYVTTFIQSWTKIKSKQPHAFLWNVTVGVPLIPAIFYPYNTVRDTLANEFADVAVDTDDGPGYVLSSTGAPVLATPRVIATGPTTHGLSIKADGRPYDLVVPLTRAVSVPEWFAVLNYQASKNILVRAPGALSQWLPRGDHRAVLDFTSPDVTSITIPVPGGTNFAVDSLSVIDPTP